MKVTFVGEINIQRMAEKLVEIASSTVERLEKEHNTKINGYSIHEADVQVKFDVEGADEPQMLTVNHHGMTEPFQWIVDMDKETEINNEDQSMFDEYSVAKAKGQEKQFEEIKSIYNDADLELEDVEAFDNMSKKVYTVLNEEYKVVKVFQDDRLIQEYKLIPISE